MKEDTALYHLVKFFKDRVSAAAVKLLQMFNTNNSRWFSALCASLLKVMRRTGKLDLTRDREKKFGSTNPAFCDIELDITKSSIPSWNLTVVSNVCNIISGLNQVFLKSNTSNVNLLQCKLSLQSMFKCTFQTRHFSVEFACFPCVCLLPQS